MALDRTRITFSKKDINRFESKTIQSDTSDCIVWIGAVKNNGYGNFYLCGKWINAHKAAWLFKNGEIPNGLMIRHICDNRLCVNTNHMVLGTHQDNMNDMVQRGRSAQKSNHFNAHFTNSQVLKMRELFDLNQKTIPDLVKMYKSKYSTVYQIVKRLRWIEKA